MKSKKRYIKWVKIGRKFYKVCGSYECEPKKEKQIDEKEKIKRELQEYEKNDFEQNRINTNIYNSCMNKRFKYLIDE